MARPPVQTPPNLRALGRGLRRNALAAIGLAMLLGMLLLATLARWIAPWDPAVPVALTIDDVYAPPGLTHWLGTDDGGRDVLTNFMYGARVSLVVGFFAAFISVFIGGAVGLAAGFWGGRLEGFLMRLTDIVLVIPDLPLIIVLVALTKPSLFNIILVIGLVGWTGTARLVRAQTLGAKQRKFVLRARAVGAGPGRIIFRHILPQVLPLIVVNTVLVLSLAILNESTLSFLGLADPTAVSWGQMLNLSFTRGAMSAGAWWALAPPGLGIAWVVLGCSLLGQGLEQLLNPRLGAHHLSRAWPAAGAEAVDPGGGAEKTAGAPVVLAVRQLTIDYIGGDGPPARAVTEVSFSLRRGEVLGLVGESGCGKTTLMLGLLRLLPPNGRIAGGQVVLAGRQLQSLSEAEMAAVRWKEIALVFQGAMNAFNPVRTIGAQIAEAIARHEPATRQSERDRRVGELLERVGLAAERGRHYPHQYSGGMRQRAMIAMALACGPQVICADEPTTALDVIIQAQILSLLDDLRRQLGLAVVLVTHDLGVVAQSCDRLMVMYGGAAVEYGAVEEVLAHPGHPYTQELLKAAPDLSRRGARLRSIPGAPPPLDALPPGCRFAPRCPVAVDRCRAEDPAAHPVGEGRWARCHRVEGGRTEVGDG